MLRWRRRIGQSAPDGNGRRPLSAATISRTRPGSASHGRCQEFRVYGERDPTRLAIHRDCRFHASSKEIIAALTGNYRLEHLFALRQNFTAYQFNLQQIAECDAAIQALLDNLAARQPPPPTTTAATAHQRHRPPKRHEPSFDIRTPLHRLTGGADLSQLDAIGPHAALQLVAEIGTDMSRWPTAKHFTSCRSRRFKCQHQASHVAWSSTARCHDRRTRAA